MKKGVLYVMLEAYRRWVVLNTDPEKPLGEKWLGLGYAGEYQSSVEGGFMNWIHGPPKPRTMGWLRLTALGEQMMQKFASRGIGAADYSDFQFNAWEKVLDLQA